MRVGEHRKRWLFLVVAAAMCASALARAQTAGPRQDAEIAAGNSGPADRGPRWQKGFELSEQARGRSKEPATDEDFIVFRVENGTANAGRETGVDHRMSLGLRGIWSTDAGLAAAASSRAGDDEKTIHYTLRHDGLRLGIFYQPGTLPAARASSAPAAPSERDSLVFAADYDRRFEGFGLAVAARYASTDTPADVDIPGMEAWTVGARFDVGDLSLSGAVRRSGEPDDDAVATAAAGWDKAWNLGARYRWGRNDVSLAYAYGENGPEVALPGDDKRDTAALNYARRLFVGVEWSINLSWADRDARAVRSPAAPDGASLSTAIRLSF